MAHKIQKYGWIPSYPDFRDLVYEVGTPRKLPSSIDLREFCPAVYDQGQLGSCTSNAVAGACEFAWIREKKPNSYTPSRLAIYYDERVIEGTPGTDSGAQVRDGLKVIHEKGFASESFWPYDVGKFATRPPQTYYSNAAFEKVVSYAAVPQTHYAMKKALTNLDPIVIGFTVYESFESDSVATDGMVPMPKADEQVLGGHAVLIVGYSDPDQAFIVRNSWGMGWGMGGYCYMPYQYLTDRALASDLWTIKLVP